MLSSVMQSGTQGMQSSLQNMSQAAQRIAQPVTSNGSGTINVTESVVELKYNVLLFQASAKVLTVSDTMIGSLLDVRA